MILRPYTGRKVTENKRYDNHLNELQKDVTNRLYKENVLLENHPQNDTDAKAQKDLGRESRKEPVGHSRITVLLMQINRIARRLGQREEVEKLTGIISFTRCISCEK